VNICRGKVSSLVTNSTTLPVRRHDGATCDSSFVKAITEKQKLKCMGLPDGVPFVDLGPLEPDPAAATIIPTRWAVSIIGYFPGRSPPMFSASFAMLDPLKLSALNELTNLNRSRH